MDVKKQKDQEKEQKSPNLPLNLEAIILAGGQGTRLRETIPGVPKVLAPVAGRPFLSFVITYLRMQGISRFVFSLGYGAQAVIQFLKETYPALDYETVVEDEALGTGGGVRLAMQKVRSEHVLIANGDTIFKADVEQLLLHHLKWGAECSIALKRLDGTGRYGTVLLNSFNQIVSFGDKMLSTEALVNGGLYIVNKDGFFNRSFPHRFSFEEDYFRKNCAEGTFFGLENEGYFIDIGVPEAYIKAQQDLQAPMLELDKVDKAWTLFIDRDGVINEETVGEYILDWDQFIFNEGVLPALKRLSDVFGRIILVTNQKGVGKGLMEKAALDHIHSRMKKEIEGTGGRLDKIYACTEVENTCFHRKPNPGMAMQAKRDFPDIDFAKSIMVGNKPSDMQFGRAAGMFTVFVATTNPDEPYPHPDVDLRFSSLANFAAELPPPATI